jgi:ketosteroid isomerase-like protein
VRIITSATHRRFELLTMPGGLDMKVERVPVTGREPETLASPRMRAVSQFYRALNNRDLDLMARNWVQTDEAVMDNPVGGIKRGWPEISAVYEKLFSHAAPFWFEFHDYSLHEAGDVFYVAGRERGEYASNQDRLAMSIRTSRIFRLIEGEWRQVHHHGSIDDPDLLRRYQRAVLGAR